MSENGRAAAHVHIENRLVLGLGQIHRAAAVGREQRLVVVTRGRANEFSRVLGEEFDNRLRVFSSALRQ